MSIKAYQRLRRWQRQPFTSNSTYPNIRAPFPRGGVVSFIFAFVFCGRMWLNSVSIFLPASRPTTSSGSALGAAGFRRRQNSQKWRGPSPNNQLEWSIRCDENFWHSCDVTFRPFRQKWNQQCIQTIWPISMRNVCKENPKRNNALCACGKVIVSLNRFAGQMKLNAEIWLAFPIIPIRIEQLKSCVVLRCLLSFHCLPSHIPYASIARHRRFPLLRYLVSKMILISIVWTVVA